MVMSNLLLLPCRKPSLYIPGNHHVDTYNMNICKYHYEMKKMNEYKSEPAQCEENAQKKVRCLVNLFLFFFLSTYKAISPWEARGVGLTEQQSIRIHWLGYEPAK